MIEYSNIAVEWQTYKYQASLYYWAIVSFWNVSLYLPHALLFLPFVRVQEQHRRLGRLRLQPQRRSAGIQGAIQVPGELTFSVAALPQPQP